MNRIESMSLLWSTKRCSHNYYATHSFFNGLDQFHYSDIWPNAMEWANDWGHVETTNGNLIDWSNDIV